MNVEFLAGNLEQYISLIAKALPTHPQVPILSNILLDATAEGLFILATDLELGVKIKIPAKVIEEGAVTVPGKQFIEVISSLSKDTVTLKLEENVVTLKSGGNKITFQTISKDEFPSLFAQKGEKIHSFKSSEFRDIFSKLIFSVSLDESRPALTGVLLTQKEEGVEFVATDGYRLSLKKLGGLSLFETDDHLILPTKLITEVLGMKTDDSLDMYTYREGNQVLFETRDVTFVGRIIGGDFPNYSRVLPTSSKTQTRVDREGFIQSIRLSSVFAKDSANIVHLKIEENTLKLFSKTSGVGEGEVSLDIEKSGDDNEIAFNVKFLLDILRSVDEKEILMELSSALEPSVFKLEKDPQFLHIIMPVKV